MNRRIRSFSGPRRRVTVLCLTLGLAATACSSDLFHDTKWQSRCDAEPDAAICPQGAGGAGGMGSTASSTGAATSASSASSASASSSASSTAGVGGSTSTSTGTGMTLATSSSTGP